MVGCSSLPPAPPSICDQLEDNDEWLPPLLSARAQYGMPVELSLALLEPPLSDTDKVHVRVRTPDWDEYRVRSENWGADSHSIVEPLILWVGLVVNPSPAIKLAGRIIVRIIWHYVWGMADCCALNRKSTPNLSSRHWLWMHRPDFGGSRFFSVSQNGTRNPGIAV